MAKMTKEQKEKCRVLTPTFRASYAHVWKAQAMAGTNNDPKYSVVMLFPKTEDLSSIKTAIKNAKEAAFGVDKATWPKVIASPVGDGDGEAGLDKKTGERKEGYAGHWAIKAATGEDQKPGIVDQHNKEILTQSAFYSGCFARAYVYAYIWEFPKGSGKYGVGFILDHLQKVDDGPAFGGKKSATEVFAPIAQAEVDDSEDMDFR